MRGERSTCAACREPVVWRRTLAGRWTPEDPDGTTHWATCMAPEVFRRMTRRRPLPDGGGLQMSFLLPGPEQLPMVEDER